MDQPPGVLLWIFDELIAGKGNLNYCVRWDSKGTLSKTTAATIAPMLQNQLNLWNDWLKNYGCWPHESVTVNVVGWATNNSALFDWSDDSLGTIFSDQVDYENIPVCNLNCYKHRNGLSTNSDLASCEGTPCDIYLQLTGGLGVAGFGYDWVSKWIRSRRLVIPTQKR